MSYRSPSLTRDAGGELAQNLTLALLVILSLLLNRQLWLVDAPGLGGEPSFRPPALSGQVPAEAFHPRDMFLHVGGGEHAHVPPESIHFASLWASTVALVGSLDRDAMALLDQEQAEVLLGRRMDATPGWQAAFATALPLDWWWEMWAQELEGERLVARAAPDPGFPSAVTPDGDDAVDYRISRALVPVDRISVFFDGPSTLAVFMGDGQRWLVTRVDVGGDEAGDVTRWLSLIPRLALDLAIYRGVPPAWMGVSISSTVLVPDLDVYRPLLLYLKPPQPPGWEMIRGFFLDHHAIREMTLDGLVGYTDGRQAVRIYPSGAIGYFSGVAPAEGAVWGWRGAVEEASWYVDRHGGWPDPVRVAGFSFPSGQDLEAVAAAHLRDQISQASTFDGFLAGGPWPERVWTEAGGLGLVLVPYVMNEMLVAPLPCLEAVVGGRGLIRFTRHLPPVTGTAGVSRTKPPFGAIADAISHLSPDEREGRMVTGVYPAYFLSSVVDEATHLTAAWVVSFACGERMFIHATNGSLLGRGR